MGLIAGVEARALGPAVERFRYTDRSEEVFTTTTLVRVTDDSGVVGIGAYDSDSFGDHDLASIETLRTIVPRLIGLDADDRDRVAALLTEDGTSPFPPAVRSTIDMRPGARRRVARTPCATRRWQTRCSRHLAGARPESANAACVATSLKEGAATTPACHPSC